MNHTRVAVSQVWKWTLGWGLALIVGLSLPATSFALISGGEGNEPLRDPGWQKGAAAVFNVKGRVAYWEGPPFGGGEYVAECRGDAKVFNTVLADFAKIDAVKRELIIHDGIGASFWLNPNGEEASKKKAEIDWAFTAWVPDRWQFQQKFRGLTEEGDGPIPVIHVFTGGKIHWADVHVPEGITVTDERLEAHGHQVSDGTVLEGQIFDLANSLPLVSTIELQLIKPQLIGQQSRVKEPIAQYETVLSVDTDAQGKWVIKSAPEGWHQVVAISPGYVSRIIAYLTIKKEPLWVGVNSGLSKPGPIEGVVLDAEGKPLAGAKVVLADVVAEPGGLYSTVTGETVMTDAEGRFHTDQLPLGTLRIWSHLTGYCLIGLGPNVKTPASDLKLVMHKAAQIEVVVEFNKSQRSEGYIVEIEPEGGSVVGSWGGSGNIDAANTITFKNVPPGRYVLKGRPNPGSANQETEPQTIELVGGETEPVVLDAK